MLRRLVRGKALVPVPANGPELSDVTGIVGTSLPATSETTAYAGGFWITLNVTLPKFRSYEIPYPPLKLVPPFPNTSHANPTRGAQLFRSGSQRFPIGLFGTVN